MTSLTDHISLCCLLSIQSVNREMKLKAHNGNEYYLVEVIAHILKYLKDEFILVLTESGTTLTATDFDWVITVPAIWKARGKQMMREAGYKVSVISSTTTLTVDEQEQANSV